MNWDRLRTARAPGMFVVGLGLLAVAAGMVALPLGVAVGGVSMCVLAFATAP
jgi:hypothetical protein